MSEWIEFAKQKPAVGQWIWVAIRGGFIYDHPIKVTAESKYESTHWKAILLPDPPPKPDPFEEWWPQLEKYTYECEAEFRKLHASALSCGRAIARECFNAGREAERKLK